MIVGGVPLNAIRVVALQSANVFVWVNWYADDSCGYKIWAKLLGSMV